MYIMLFLFIILRGQQMISKRLMNEYFSLVGPIMKKK